MMTDDLDGPTLLAQALQTRGILLDLIAELSKYKHFALLEEYRPIRDALWKAEARLREVTE